MSEPKMTDAQVMELLRGTSPLNLARREFSSGSARIEQAGLQRTPLGPIEMRRMEFEAVTKILRAFGVEVSPTSAMRESK